MKCILLMTVSLFFSTLCHAEHHEAKDTKAAPYRHVVLFKFKDTSTKEQIAHIEKEFSKLPKKIDTITGYEWGTNVSPENHDQGFTHCFIVSFKDKKGLEAYLPHPDHKAFVKQLLPILDKVLVIDFVAQS